MSTPSAAPILGLPLAAPTTDAVADDRIFDYIPI
jgi:hypothetical protein